MLIMNLSEVYKIMRPVNRKIRNFLLNKIKASNNNKQLNFASMAVRAIESGKISDRALKAMGYKD